MVFKKCKMGLLTILVLVIISVAGKAWSFPLPTNDFQRIASSVQVGMQQVMQIKQEIESNLNIIKEIQNGGYAAAAGDLFAKIQNGDYDRFGDNLKGLKSSTYDATHSAQKVKERKEKEEADRQAKEKAELEKQKAAKEKGDAAAEESHKSFFKRGYNWIKDNRLVTDSALGAVNAANNNDWSNVVNDAARSAGGAIGGSDGNELSALGGIVSSGMDIVGNSNDLGEFITHTATNGKLTDNLNVLNQEHEALEAKLKEAQEQADREQAERIKEQMKQLEEKMAQERKEQQQKECQACRSQNPNSPCISACSF